MALPMVTRYCEKPLSLLKVSDFGISLRPQSDAVKVPAAALFATPLKRNTTMQSIQSRFCSGPERQFRSHCIKKMQLIVSPENLKRRFQRVSQSDSAAC